MSKPLHKFPSTRTAAHKKKLIQDDAASTRVATAPRPRWHVDDIASSRQLRPLTILAKEIPLADVPAMKSDLMAGIAAQPQWKNRTEWPKILQTVMDTLEKREKELPVRASTDISSANRPPARVSPAKPQPALIFPAKRPAAVVESPSAVSAATDVEPANPPAADVEIPPEKPPPAVVAPPPPSKPAASPTWDLNDALTADGRRTLRAAANALSDTAELDKLAADLTTLAASHPGQKRGIDGLLGSIESRKRALALQAKDALEEAEKAQIAAQKEEVRRAEEAARQERRALAKKKRDARPAQPAITAEYLTPGVTNKALQETWTDILKTAKGRALTETLGTKADWRNIPPEKRVEITERINSALMHLSKSRVPVIQSSMHVAALATRSSMSPTPTPLEIRVTDPVRLDDGTTAAGRAGSNLVEISGYKPGDQHTEPSVTEAAETIIHELTHWISFGMYSGNRVDGGNPPWLTDDRLNKRKGNKAVDTTKDKEENAERIQSVTYAIEDIGDATLDGDLNVLSGVQSTAQHSKY